VLAAVAGALCISTSAIVMRLAGSSASVLALGRSGFALPVLLLLVFWLRRRGGAGLGALTMRARWVARLAGVFLAADLVLWAHSIDNIGAGLSTVLSNIQVILVPLLAWTLLGERPRRSLVVAGPVMVLGLVLVGGLLTGGGYGANPGLGLIFGIGVGALYAGYILLLRQAAAQAGSGSGSDAGGAGGWGAAWASAVATLFEATFGAAAGSLVLGLALRDFRLGPAWPALGWLVVLALTSGVLGWLLLTVSLPRLAAWLGSALLLVQPAGSVLLGSVFLSERPSLAQLAGVVLMLGGVLIAARGATAARADTRDESVFRGADVAAERASADESTNADRDKPCEPTIPAT
jgi:drug/metabolite transporter (DMT)-like permease